MDRDHDDQIDITDFERGLTRLGIIGRMSKEDIKQIFTNLTIGNGVTVTLRSFTKYFFFFSRI